MAVKSLGRWHVIARARAQQQARQRGWPAEAPRTFKVPFGPPDRGIFVPSGCNIPSLEFFILKRRAFPEYDRLVELLVVFLTSDDSLPRQVQDSEEASPRIEDLRLKKTPYAMNRVFVLAVILMVVMPPLALRFDSVTFGDLDKKPVGWALYTGAILAGLAVGYLMGARAERGEATITGRSRAGTIYFTIVWSSLGWLPVLLYLLSMMGSSTVLWERVSQIPVAYLCVVALWAYLPIGAYWREQLGCTGTD
ncbi:MAG: hypothetical protein KAW89_08370 [Armatimonadetes bacterium]|nr:hypothetical protein [Armatimonadota bacterium]